MSPGHHRRATSPLLCRAYQGTVAGQTDDACPATHRSGKAAVMALHDTTQQELLRALPHLRAFAISSPAMSTGPTTWCRRRFCARWPTSIGSSPEPVCRLGFSRSCGTCSTQSFAAGEGGRGSRWNSCRPLGGPAEPARFRRVRRAPAALAKLPPDQREALLLVSAQGFSYEEAAQITGTQLGTIKSRVNRARRGSRRSR